MSKTNFLLGGQNIQASTLHLENANPSWKLLLQAGVGFPCTVGISMSDLVSEELELTKEQFAIVEALVLDGMPVDDPDAAIVPDGARVALAAGLPGIAGLSMKKDSAVKVLRATITHIKDETPDPRPGHIVLALYSLVLPVLAEHFLSRGILVEAKQLRRYLQFAPEDTCVADSKTVGIGDFLDRHPDEDLFLLTASIDPSKGPAENAGMAEKG